MAAVVSNGGTADAEPRAQYIRGRAIGDGTFAVVHVGMRKKVQNCDGGIDDGNGDGGGAADEEVALKRFKPSGGEQSISSATREIQAFRAIDEHYQGGEYPPHVIQLLDIVSERTRVFSSSNRLTLVLPLCLWDLDQVIIRPATRLNASDVKAYAHGLFSGIAACHAAGVAHRDVKANNLLVARDGTVKLTDLGSSWQVIGSIGDVGKQQDAMVRSRTLQVGTRWYRPPDILYGNRAYGFELDLWATGCVIGEMVKREPLFQGNSDIDQLNKIFKVLGTPKEKDWPGMSSLPFYMRFGECAGEPLKEYILRSDYVLDNFLLDLLSKLLVFDPSKRVTAKDALNHPWFFEQPRATPAGSLAEPTGETSVENENGFDDFGSNSDSSDSEFGWAQAETGGGEVSVQETGGLSQSTASRTTTANVQVPAQAVKSLPSRKLF